MAKIQIAEDLIFQCTTSATSTSKAAMKCIAAAFTVACVTANEYLPETAGARKCAKLWERCNGIVPPIGPCEVGASCTDGMYVAERRILSLTAQNGLPAKSTAAKPQKLCPACALALHLLQLPAKQAEGRGRRTL
eukprot:1263-Heterococcus_DN1.PRE.2